MSPSKLKSSDRNTSPKSGHQCVDRVDGGKNPSVFPDFPFQRRLTYGSLFSGVGGFDLGFDRAGFSCAWQVERDKQALQILGEHWPKVRKHEDVTTFKKRGYRAVDVICGGFPCQDLSVAGKRAGLAGSRSGLFFEFMRIVSDFAPKWVLIENVPGLLSSNGGRDMGTVVHGLAQRGYGWAYRVLDSQYLGLAQRRKRVFIVGCLGDVRGAAQVLFESESLPWNPPPSREAGKDSANALAPSLRGSGVGTERAGDTRGQDCVIPVSHTLNAKNGNRFDGESETFVAYQCQGTNVGEMGTLRKGNGNVTGGVPFIAHTLRAEGHDASEDGTGRGVPLVAATLRSRQHSPGVSMPGRGGEDDQNLVAQTLKGNTGRNHIECDCLPRASGVRRLTPRECERLQGFPDDWTVQLSDSARYRCLGNAVSVPVALWIAKRIGGAK